LKQVVIASVYPIARRIVRERRHPVNTFEVAACPKGAPPTLLVIGSNYESEKVPLQERTVDQEITAMETAEDFIRSVTTNQPYITADAHPGIWMCAGSTPTEEEIAFNTERQEAFFRNLVHAADDLEKNGKSIQITDLMRTAAEWLNYRADWRHKATANDNKNCPFCTKLIPGVAVICPECHQVVDFDKWAEMEARKVAALRNAGVSEQPVKPPARLQPNVPMNQQTR
jgi:hypothetical protein